MPETHEPLFNFGGPPQVESAPEAEPITRSMLRAQRQQPSRRRRRKGRRGLVLMVTLALLGAASFGAYTVLGPVVAPYFEDNDYAGQGAGNVEITIPPGASGRTIGRILEERGVVKSAEAFADAATANPKSASIQPGFYVLRRQMSGEAALTMLLDPVVAAAGRLTIQEGLRVSEIVGLLARSTKRPVTEYEAALKDPKGLGLPTVAGGKVEGWLFPGTYSFGKKTAKQQLTEMIQTTVQTLDAAGVPADKYEQTLILASIAQVEARATEDFPKVTRVLLNRLAGKLSADRKLQLDSTVSYAVNRRSLLTSAADRQSDSPYNTYRFGGLPPGPISNPGKAAIDGALNPVAGDWLFFVTVDPVAGTTKFAATGAEHEANVLEFQKWCRANPKSC